MESGNISLDPVVSPSKNDTKEEQRICSRSLFSDKLLIFNDSLFTQIQNSLLVFNHHFIPISRIKFVTSASLPLCAHYNTLILVSTVGVERLLLILGRQVLLAGSRAGCSE